VDNLGEKNGLKKNNLEKMKKVFIDGGTNLCQGLSQIMKIHNMDESWIIYSFEVNPNTFNSIDKSKFSNVTFINKGLWSENCIKLLTTEIVPGRLDGIHSEFLIDKDMSDKPVGGASNVIGDEWIKPMFVPDEYINTSSNEVECIDFSEFIKNNFDKSDHIVLKLDVEGAEYPILKKMIQDGTIDYINEMYVEWHQRLLKVDHNESELRKNIESRNIKINDWN
jgi:FkbM family methyltransferase